MPTLTVDTREGHLGITTSNASVCAGVSVDALHAKDLLALAGLQAGMVITHVDGVAVEDHQYCQELFGQAKAEQKKLTLAYLTADEARAQGELEWNQTKKILYRVLLVLVAVACLVVAAVQQGYLTRQMLMSKMASMSPAADLSKPSPNNPNGDPDRTTFPGYSTEDMDELSKHIAQSLGGTVGGGVPDHLKEKIKSSLSPERWGALEAMLTRGREAAAAAAASA